MPGTVRHVHAAAHILLRWGLVIQLSNLVLDWCCSALLAGCETHFVLTSNVEGQQCPSWLFPSRPHSYAEADPKGPSHCADDSLHNVGEHVAYGVTGNQGAAHFGHVASL